LVTILVSCYDTNTNEFSRLCGTQFLETTDVSVNVYTESHPVSLQDAAKPTPRVCILKTFHKGKETIEDNNKLFDSVTVKKLQHF
jgi:hypothetical protein